MKKNTMKQFCTKVSKKVVGTTLATMAVVRLSVLQAFATLGSEDNKGLINNYQEGIKDIVAYLGSLVGFGMLAFGVFNLILALRNEDSEGRNKALLNIVAGVALTGVGLFVGFFIKSS